MPRDEYRHFELGKYKYYVYIDKSSNGDYWVETITRRDDKGNYTILSCNVVPKEEEKDAS